MESHVLREQADGVLTLTIPVADEAKPRRIAVQHSGDTAQLTAEADSVA